MNVDVVNEIFIDRPIAPVAAFSADPSNAPRWYGRVQSVEWLSEPVVREGATFRFTVDTFGIQQVYTLDVTAYLPAERLVMRTLGGPFPLETTYLWSIPTAGATRMVVRIRGRATGLSSISAPSTATILRRGGRRNLETLKAILEHDA